MAERVSRRTFLRGAALGGASLVILRDAASAGGTRANQRLNVALIGVGGRGTWFVDTIPRMENVVALCDVDDRKVAETFGRWADLAKRFAVSPHDWERNSAPAFQRLTESRPRTFPDFRVMLDQMGREIDAVIVSTPDHTHAVASAAAMRAGKPVYCEKPLTRTVAESRALRELARRQRVATSMGNQGTATGQFRRALELIRGGSLGEIREVVIWNSGGGSDRREPPKDAEPVPEGLNWDLWLGPAAARPYHREWMHRNNWRDFGTCQLGNWASHSANLAFMSLRVHDLWLADPVREPRPVIRVTAQSSGINRLSFPRWETIRWEIPARGSLPPIAFTWYNGPAPGAREALDPLFREGSEPERDRGGWPFAGTLIGGPRGRVHTTGHNAWFRLLPEDQFRGVQVQRPETVEPSRGHEADWFLACRGGAAPWASFDYADALNEFLMLGNVATQFEGTLDFEPVACRIVNHAEADAALRSEYRQGWSL